MKRLRESSSEQRPLPSPTTQFRELNDHIYELYKPLGEPTMEILFFHGLQFGNTNNAYWSTWTCGNTSDLDLVWPAAWLAEEFPDAHIFSISYDSSMRTTNEQGRSELYNLAENLIASISWARIGQGHCRPVILVGHCFGGLVIKQLCVKAHQILSLGPDSRNMNKIQIIERFLLNVGGFFFYGTPHRGSHLADKATYFLKGPLLVYVTSLSAASMRLEEEFDALRKKYKMWPIAGLGEELPTSWGPFHGVVVPEASARYGDFGTIAADHISLCKPKKRTSNSFQHLINFISNVKPKEVRFDNIQQLPKAAVGLKLQVKTVLDILQKNTRVGIFGMGGKGKTTLAKAVFNKLGPTFEYTCFVPEVKLIAGCMMDLKKEVWKLMHYNGKNVEQKEDGWAELRGKQLLLILDDVAHDRDLEVLLNIAHHTAPESRCIMTSRDTELLNRLEDVHVHPMSFLSETDAKQLFRNYAFPNLTTLPVSLERHVNLVVKKCDGLPLTIEIIGKYLKSKENVTIWEQALEALDRAEAFFKLDERLWDKLRISYNGLGEKEQQIFLDATSMFIGKLGQFDESHRTGWTLREAKAGWRVTYGMEQILWQNLVDMSLVYDVQEDETIKVHEQLMSLGKKIALESSNKGKWRVWDKENKMALELLRSTAHNHGCGSQEIYSFLLRGDYKKDYHYPKHLGHVVKFSNSFIRKLENVQYLDLEVMDLVMDHGVEENEVVPVLRNLVLLRAPGLQFGQRILFDPALLPRLAVLKLTCLHNVKFLPSSFGQLVSLKVLVIANARELEILPDEFGHLSKLERLTFGSCEHLLTLPETFGGLSSLQHLEFSWAKKLQSIPQSFGQLSELKHLKFGRCNELQTIPESFGQLSALQHLEFITCESLQTLPSSFGHLSALKHLEFFECEKLHALPESFGQLSALEHLEFIECESLQTLPDSFGHLCALKNLEFFECEKLHAVPESFGQLSALEHLEFIECGSLQALPQSFGHLSALKHLEFFECEKLRALPEFFGQLSALEHLEFIECHNLHTLPESFGALAKLQVLKVVRCYNVEMLPFAAGQLGSLRHLIIDFVALTIIPDFPSLEIFELGILPEIQRFPPWVGEGLAASRKIFHIRDGKFSLQQKRNLSSGDQKYLINWLHGIAMARVMAFDYRGAAAVLDLDSPGLNRGLLGFILQERGIIKRMMGELDGALEDLTTAFQTIQKSKSDNLYSFDPEHASFQCLKHRGFVRFLKGDMEGAVGDAKEALKLQHWEIGQVRPPADSLGEGIVTYLNFKLVGMKESQEHEKLLLSSHSRAMKKVRGGCFHEALTDLDAIDARILSPERRVFLLQERGILKRLMDDLEGALADLCDALEINFRYGQDDYRCRKHRGFVKYLTRDFDGAEMDAERALEIGPPTDIDSILVIVEKKFDDYKAELGDPDELAVQQKPGHRGCLGKDAVMFLGFELDG